MQSWKFPFLRMVHINLLGHDIERVDWPVYYSLALSEVCREVGYEELGTLDQGELDDLLCGKRFLTFHFVEKQDTELIFRSDPYFMGLRGF